MSFSRKRTVAYILLMTVLVVGSSFFHFTIPYTNFNYNFGDVFLVIAALTFGPIVGGIAGGLGYAISDIFSGWYQFWFYNLIIKGVQGASIGYIATRNSVKSNKGKIFALMVGSVISFIGYYILYTLLYGTSWSYNLLLEYFVPSHIIQLFIAGVIGIPSSIFIDQRLSPSISSVSSQQVPIGTPQQVQPSGIKEIVVGITLMIIFYATLTINAIPVVWIGALISGIIYFANGLWKVIQKKRTLQTFPVAKESIPQQRGPKKCRICGWSNPNGFLYCGKCGNPLEEDSTKIY